jgi:hypothetical protein
MPYLWLVILGSKYLVAGTLTLRLCPLRPVCSLLEYLSTFSEYLNPIGLQR